MASTHDDGAQADFLVEGDAGSGGLRRLDAITDDGLAHVRDAYQDQSITKDDLFFFTYGILHSQEYRELYGDNLTKELPRVPILRDVIDFRSFCEAGRKLSDLHVGFEDVEPYPVTIAQGDLRLADISDPETYFRVEQMRFAGRRPNIDRTTVVYNSRITMTDVPLAAYDYMVNGKSALEWIMDRQGVWTDRKSGIASDANRYSVETACDPAYPLKLFQRMITVSLRTMEIVRALPALDIKAPL